SSLSDAAPTPLVERLRSPVIRVVAAFADADRPGGDGDAQARAPRRLRASTFRLPSWAGVAYGGTWAAPYSSRSASRSGSGSSSTRCGDASVFSWWRGK